MELDLTCLDLTGSRHPLRTIPTSLLTTTPPSLVGHPATSIWDHHGWGCVRHSRRCGRRCQLSEGAFNHVTSGANINKRNKIRECERKMKSVGVVGHRRPREKQNDGDGDAGDPDIPPPLLCNLNHVGFLFLPFLVKGR